MTSPNLFSSLDLPEAINGIIFSDTENIIYAVSDNNGGELIIILPEQP
ncbi:hypothetical protein ACFL14_01020 [Patescibacteria group bacterium]